MSQASVAWLPWCVSYNQIKNDTIHNIQTLGGHVITRSKVMILTIRTDLKEMHVDECET